ncbi:MAG: urate hydroxylase PuuD [Nitrospinae bacterium]|nr:urate hydroxylase PuuD [Nitrospinota bacterium]
MWTIEFLHVLFGILWIGLLYFFNLVQVQSMPKMTEAGAAKPYAQIILPKALFYFRWAALLTAVTGIVYYVAARWWTEKAVTGVPGGVIMIGMFLGLVMAFNVWFIIWPNQKQIIAGALEGDALSKARRMAFLASRTNAWLSLPMLACMVAANHGGFGF